MLAIQDQLQGVRIPSLQQGVGIGRGQAGVFLCPPNSTQAGIDGLLQPAERLRVLGGQEMLELQGDNLGDQVAGQPHRWLGMQDVVVMADDHAPEPAMYDERHGQGGPDPHVAQVLHMQGRDGAQHDRAQIQRRRVAAQPQQRGGLVADVHDHADAVAQIKPPRLRRNVRVRKMLAAPARFHPVDDLDDDLTVHFTIETVHHRPVVAADIGDDVSAHLQQLRHRSGFPKPLATLRDVPQRPGVVGSIPGLRLRLEQHPAISLCECQRKTGLTAWQAGVENWQQSLVRILAGGPRVEQGPAAGSRLAAQQCFQGPAQYGDRCQRQKVRQVAADPENPALAVERGKKTKALDGPGRVDGLRVAGEQINRRHPFRARKVLVKRFRGLWKRGHQGSRGISRGNGVMG